MTFLGIDLGTSEVKLLLTDADSVPLATGSAPLSLDRPHPHWSEQSPQAWWHAMLDAIAAVRAAHPAGFAALRGIALSGQMHGATLLDRAGQVLRPAMLWNDTRAGAECVELEALVPESRAITGNMAMPGFTAPKLLWLAKYEPTVFRAIHKVLLPKDYLIWRLSGEFVSDLSDASGTLWLDCARREWSGRMLAASDLSIEQMPRLVEGNAAAAQLRDSLRREWGIAGPVTIAGGAGDNAASAIGMGVTGAGGGFLSLGTSGVLFAGNERFAPNPDAAVHAFCHCLPGRWHQMSVILSAAASLDWLARTQGDSAAELAARAERAAAARAPIFLPYLGGERTPHNDAHARGVFFGMTNEHGAEDLAYAVMEGVAFAMADGHDALRAAGTELEAVSFIGGGSRSAFWARLCANATGIAMHRHADGAVGAALGAARLARLAATDDALSAVCVVPPIAQTIRPDGGAELLAPRLARYRRLYRLLREEFAHGD
ncbi:xylulokinase [Burkholderia gladioli]|uniref:xylulokinase n=1 Tax=Burkholderia gladioli TaxID=28095 RepID=UPI00163E14A1|nr:xylulokinase [Burkholderia gladioli]